MKIKFGIAILCFTSFLIFSSPALFSQEETSPKPSWVSLWKKARDLEGKGAYQEAKKIYESLLEQKALGGQASSIHREYNALRVKMIFSPIETPDSFFYTVAPGDTLSEIAKKFGTTVSLLKKSNGLSSEDRIYSGMKLKVTQVHFSIWVEKRRNRLVLLVDGKPLKKYKVATGEKGSTPAGSFKIINKLESPTWFHAGAIVPPDSPENILGSRWLGFDLAGYGIHGTTLPETIGTQASKGCIRMLNSDVEEIYDLLPVGSQVIIKE